MSDRTGCLSPTPSYHIEDLTDIVINLVEDNGRKNNVKCFFTFLPYCLGR